MSYQKPHHAGASAGLSTHIPGRLVMGAVLGLLLLGSWHAEAATFTVNDTTDAPDASGLDGLCHSTASTCTLRAAVMQANYAPGKDTIVLPAGTFLLSIPGVDENGAATGDLDIRYPVDLSGAGMGDTVIDGNGLDRVVHVLATAPGSRIRELTLRGGATAASSAFPAGGGLYNQGDELLLEQVTITDNTAVYHGGGIASTADLSLQRCRVQNNAGDYGGGIMVLDGQAKLTLQRSAVLDNTAWGTEGGGIYVSGSLEVRQSTIAGNLAQFVGGGIKIGGSTPSSYLLENVTISGNKACSHGGGLATSHDIFLDHVTITGNDASPGHGGGIAVASGKVAVLQGSIVFDNESDAQPSDCSGSISSNGGNLIGNTSGCNITLTATDAPPGTDPQLGPLQGQPLPVHPIGATSPARDFVAAPCLLFDALDTPRPQGPDCDAGAYEIHVSGSSPVAVDDSYTNQPIGPVFVAAPGVLLNDYSPSSFPLTAQLEYIDPSVGAVGMNGNGAFLFVPANFTSPNAAFSYRAAYGAVVSNVATVSITRKLPEDEVPVLLEVPEIPWLFPGPYGHDCLAVWDQGTLASQIAGEGAWNARESGWSRGSRRVEFEGWIEDYQGNRYSITGSYDGEVLEGSVIGPDRSVAPLYARASASCNALTSVEG